MTTKPDDDLDCVVIGAGVIGIAVGRALSLAGRQVVVLEAEREIATHSSSRNSEVIHAGIYYRADSLKAKLCVEGRQMLYEYCRARDVPHRQLGKIIIACDDDERLLLDGYAASAAANGVDDLIRLDAREVRRMEPAVRCVAGLLSPSTGIVDSHAFIAALRSDLEAAGGLLFCRSRVTSIAADSGAFRICIADEGDQIEVRCRLLVNSAGLCAQSLARTAGLGAGAVPDLHLAKGHYFVLQGRSPFNRLVYPVAGNGGLGIHVTLDTGGAARFGPDVTWVDAIDYRFDATRSEGFVAAIRRYFPDLDPARLLPGYTGIRPKLSGAGAPAADFAIQDERVHGVAGLINLFGIESPGLTASLALADRVASRLAGRPPKARTGT